MNTAHDEDSISTKPDSNSVSVSSAPVPNVCTEDDPDPIQPQQENPQALSHTDKAQDTTAKMITEIKEMINTAKPSVKPKNCSESGNVVTTKESEGAECSTGSTRGNLTHTED